MKQKKNIYFVYFYLKLTPHIPPTMYVFYPTPSMYNSSLKAIPSHLQQFSNKQYPPPPEKRSQIKNGP